MTCPSEQRVTATIAPCKWCTKRHEACHATCTEYGDWKQMHDKARAARSEHINNYFKPPATQRRIDRAMRKNRKKYKD